MDFGLFIEIPNYADREYFTKKALIRFFVLINCWQIRDLDRLPLIEFNHHVHD